MSKNYLNEFIKSRNARLPMWRRVIFVDWHGVLSKDIFWFSILGNSGHQYHNDLDAATRRLFRDHSQIVQSWMRGEIDSAAIVEMLAIKLDKRYKEDFLLRRLRDDCARMRVHVPLLRELATANSFVVIATDNMDCFIGELYRQRDIVHVIDDVLCSSQIGVLKTEDVQLFFKPWLDAHELTFSEALLIDDTPSICDAFIAKGGSAIEFKSFSVATEKLRRWLS